MPFGIVHGLAAPPRQLIRQGLASRADDPGGGSALYLPLQATALQHTALSRKH